MEPVTVATDSGDRPGGLAGSGLSASQRRAELRRRKLLMNSEQRINRIMGFHRPGSSAGESLRFPRYPPPPARRSLGVLWIVSLHPADLFDQALLSDLPSGPAP